MSRSCHSADGHSIEKRSHHPSQSNWTKTPERGELTAGAGRMPRPPVVPAAFSGALDDPLGVFLMGRKHVRSMVSVSMSKKGKS